MCIYHVRALDFHMVENCHNIKVCIQPRLFTVICLKILRCKYTSTHLWSQQSDMWKTFKIRKRQLCERKPVSCPCERHPWTYVCSAHLMLRCHHPHLVNACWRSHPHLFSNWFFTLILKCHLKAQSELPSMSGYFWILPPAFFDLFASTPLLCCVNSTISLTFGTISNSVPSILFYQKLSDCFACLSFTSNLELTVSISKTYPTKKVLLEFYWDDIYIKNNLGRIIIFTSLSLSESMVCISTNSHLILGLL